MSCVAEGAAAASARVVVTTTTTTTSKGTMTWTGSVTEEGTCTINASTGGGSGSARVAVKAPRTVTTASMNNLARTGTDSSTLLWGAGGLGAIALGTAGMVVSRKRTNDAR
ncbi:LPXTG cell wall anchor domain-containing protein [Arthrobacter sp. MDT3-44]